MNPTVILAGVLAALLAMTGAYVQGRRDGGKIAEGTKAREERLAREAYEAGQKGAATEIAKLTVTHTTIKQKVEKEIYEKPVYRDCKHSPDGLLWVNAALAGTVPPSSGKLSRELGDSGKRDVRGNGE